MFLQSVDCLQPAVQQTACTLLAELKDAQINHRSSIQAVGDNVRLSVDECGVCFANPSYHQNSCSSASSYLPTSLLETFKTYSISVPERKQILEAFFRSHQFDSAVYLAETLDQFCSAAQELFETSIVSLLVEGPDQYCQNSSSLHLSLHQLKSIVALARTFMQEFEGISMSGEESSPQHGALHMASVVYSEISQSTRTSLKYKSNLLPDSTDPAQQKAYQKQSLEEFSLILSLKDAVLSSLPADSNEHSIIVSLVGDIFPSCDIQGLLAHEASVREGLAVKAREDRGAAESARESRAASAMQMVQDEHQPSEGMNSVTH